jgi:hypothetical protein
MKIKYLFRGNVITGLPAIAGKVSFLIFNISGSILYAEAYSVNYFKKAL